MMQPHASSARPVILNQLGPVVSAALAAHPSRPEIRDRPIGEQPWDVEDAEILLTAPHRAWQRAPEQAPPRWPGRLRWVQVSSTGVDWFPRWLLDTGQVTCGRGHNAAAIAEYALTAMLTLEKRFDRISIRSAADWKRQTLGTLHGRTLGLAGYGAIGRAIAVRAKPFGLRVLALRRSGWNSEDPDVLGVDSLADLFARSDHLVLALPLTDATRGCVDASLLLHAKPGLHLVNVARGGLVDQPALLAALDAGIVDFATLDVTDPEPLPDGHPIYAHPRIRLTPHLSWSGEAAGSGAPERDALTRQIVRNLDAFVRGEALQHVVDPGRGY